MAPEQRERVLLSWGDSRLPQRRAAFQALRKGALLFYDMVPGRYGGRNPAWDAIGYDGPLGNLAEAPPKALSTTPVDRDTSLQCDVVIVGSRAGGGAAAGVLASAGLDVVVVESGDYYDDRDFEGSEFGAITRYYMAAPTATHDQSVGLVAGSCLGGGTVVNYSTSFRTPDDVRQQWAEHGVAAFTSDDYTTSLDAVWERLGVNQEHNEPSTREQKLQEGCVKLGWHVDAMPRNVRHCAQGKECGYCGLGCRVGAKQSVVKTWLADAQEAGARLIVRTRVQQVLIEGGAARGAP
jgi:long-chain-alcohol oxidase